MSYESINKGNLDDGITYLGATYDGAWNSFKSYMNWPDRLANVGKYSFSKFGNGLTLLQMSNHALHDKWQCCGVFSTQRLGGDYFFVAWNNALVWAFCYL